MNRIHDNANKRTSINELLNPVANGAPRSLDTPNYPSGQVNGYTGPQYMSQDRPPAASDRSVYHPVMNVPGGSFSLRAASWDQRSNNEVNPRQEQEAEYPSACQYTSSPPHAYASSDNEYPDPYARPRPTGEHANIGMDVPPPSSSWSQPPSHESPPSSSFSSSMQAPIYSNERTAIASKPPSKEYSPPQTMPPASQQGQQTATHPTQPTQPTQYRQDVAHQAYNGNGYIPVMIARAPPIHPAVAHHPAPPGVAVTTPPMYMHAGVMPYPPYPYAYVQQPPAQPSAKRPLETEDEDAGGKAKRAKGKPPSGSESNGNGVSKRKRRNEAVPGSPFSPQVMAAMSKEKGKGRDSPMGISPVVKMVVATAPMHLEPTRPKMDPELQSARCMSNRYKSTEFPRCVSCTRRWAGDTCRFQGVRYFLKDQFGSLVGISFVEVPQEDPNLRFPDKWNISFGHYYINRIKRSVAQALLPVLKEEQEHQKHKGVVRRQRETDVRATCDTCMTSLFACTWMCRQCGREACKDCYSKIEQLTIAAPDAGPAEVVGLQAKKERHAHQNPFFLACNRRSEHTAAEFNRVSRFSDEELSAAVEAMEAYLATPEEPFTPPPIATRQPPTNDQIINSSDIPSRDTSQVHAGETTGIDPTPLISAPPSGAPSPLPTHSVRRFTNDEFNDTVFHDNWINGEPLVVTGTLSNFRIQWTPEYLSATYGNQEVVVLDCQGEGNKRLTVSEFFTEFGKYKDRKEIWKLKDWPPTQDFKSAFPDLYNDFAGGTPVPNYVRRDGVLNLASHFPTNTVSPDMGPKMYNAMASSESPGSKGTTRLHMDASDAVNIMMYASDDPDGKPGCAVWDLYRPEDTFKLKKFLRKKCKNQLGPNHQRDPIHSQQCFLDSQLRQELFDETGIMSYRIFQYPGDAVFIPAGYTHQVCNLADCIKVATDFVSPENIARCEVLTKEFRDQNQSGAWKEDILQLRTMMWFAWLSCINQEKELES